MWQSKARPAVVLLAALCLLPRGARADIRLKIAYAEGERTGEMYMYFKGVRQRDEHRGRLKDGKPFQVAFVYQCDLRRFLWLDDANRRYTDEPYTSLEEVWAQYYERQQRQKQPARRVEYGGRLTEVVRVTDTGERREMFGYTARHIRTTTTLEASPAACKQTGPRQETDGWYVDLLYGTQCSADISGFQNVPYIAPSGKCAGYYDKHRYRLERRQVGAARFGFPLALTITAYGDDGKAYVTRREVVELTTAELDAALFELPAGYTRFEPRRESLLDRAFSIFGWR